MPEKSTAQSRVRPLALCGLFAALITAGAYITVPIPYVPISLQTFFVLMAGLLLGEKLGAAAAAAYLALGLLGLPVFTGGGGIGYIVHPTFGYILGFVPAAYTAGLLSRKLARGGFWGVFSACIVSSLVIYLVGVPFLYLIRNFYLGSSMPLATALKLGFFVTLPGDILKCLLAAGASIRVLRAVDVRS
jgi:biotin transport system substrate-specific component